MKLKKIVAVVLVCVMCISVFAIPANAIVTNVPNNISHFVDDVSEDFNSYRNGDISLTDFLDLYAKNCLKFGYNNFSDLSNIKNVLLHLQNLGIDVPEAWLKYYYEYNEIEKDESFLDGYGAVAVVKIYSRTYGLDNTSIYYGDYGIIKKEVVANIYGSKIIRKYIDNRNNANPITYEFSGSKTLGGAFTNDSYTYAETVFYGDWRYENGETASDEISELPEKPPPNYDDDGLTDDDLIDFLEDLLDDLQMEYPDLSTIEGLLRAILAKLGTLDSDNDNELLSQILTAIEALKNNGETADNSELLKTLEELKNALVFKDGDKISSLAEMLNTLVQNQVRRSDITIDPSLYNQRYALIEAKLLGKFSFISSIKALIDYALDKYSHSVDTPQILFTFNGVQHCIDFSMYDGVADLVRWLLAAFIYLSYAFKTFRKIPSYVNGGDNE